MSAFDKDRLNLQLSPNCYCINSNVAQSAGDFPSKRIDEWMENGAKTVSLWVKGKEMIFERKEIK